MAASFRCYDNSDVIAFLIMTNFHLYLIKLWWQFFQMFVCGDVVMLRIGRYWPWKTVTVSSHLHMPVRPLLLHRMALVSFRLYDSEKFGQLARIFWANGLPPPLAKNFPYAYALFSLFALLIFYWQDNPTLTPFKVIFKTGNRFHQVNDSKVPYMLISCS